MLLRNLLVTALAGTSAAETFSFEEWIDGIIANPDGDNLSSDEAVAAWEISVNNTENDLGKRASCNTHLGQEANVPDAVWCIDDLARKGAGGTMCRVCPSSSMCRHRTAMILGVASSVSGPPCVRTNCNEIARAAGKVMDRCTRADGKVQGNEYTIGGRIAVHIAKP